MRTGSAVLDLRTGRPGTPHTPLTVRLLLLSNGMGYLAGARDLLAAFVPADARTVAFVPFASVRLGFDAYTALVRPVVEGDLGLRLRPLHRESQPIKALDTADLVLVGGGNTWVLRRRCHDLGLLEAIRLRIRAGISYVGWSAGANLACPTVITTNDMCVLDPVGLGGIGLVPFQINPHYIDGTPPGFGGETREERIAEALELNRSATVVGLREGSGLRVEGQNVRLVAEASTLTCRVFRHASTPVELGTGADLDFLLDAAPIPA